MKPDEPPKYVPGMSLRNLAAQFGVRLKNPQYPNSVLYAPCKCGSGKKFKWCCFRKKEEKA